MLLTLGEGDLRDNQGALQIKKFLFGFYLKNYIFDIK